MLLTIPCGQDAAVVPWHRVYGEGRLPKLLKGFEVVEQEFCVKRADNRWYPSDRRRRFCLYPLGIQPILHCARMRWAVLY
jgi:hypothetical protein